MINRHNVFFLGVILAITGYGCSPYVYKQEVGTFQSGVAEASKLLDSQADMLAKRSLDINKDDLREAGFPRLVFTDDCLDAMGCLDLILQGGSRLGKSCAKSVLGPKAAGADGDADLHELVSIKVAAECRLVTSNGIEVEIPGQLRKQKLVLASLERYANALAGLVDAKDREELAAAATKTCASTQTLFTTAASARFGKENNSADATSKAEDAKRIEAKGKAVGEVCGLVSTVGAALLDQSRLKVLKRAVNEGDQAVQTLAGFLAGEARHVNKVMLRNEREKLQQAQERTVGLRGDRYFAAVETARAQSQKYVAALKNSPDSVFRKMGTAHVKLKDAVNDPNTQLQSAIDAIQSFYDSAKAAHDAVEALAEKKKKKG